MCLAQPRHQNSLGRNHCDWFIASKGNALIHLGKERGRGFHTSNYNITHDLEMTFCGVAKLENHIYKFVKQ